MSDSADSEFTRDKHAVSAVPEIRPIHPDLEQPQGRDEFSSTEIPNYVVCELVPGGAVAAPPGVPSAAPPTSIAAFAAGLHSTLAHFAILGVEPLLGANLDGEEAGGPSAFAISTPAALTPRGDSGDASEEFLAIFPEDPQDCAALAEALAATPGVRKAYVAPRPEPAGDVSDPDLAAAEIEGPMGAASGSRNFEPAQGYLADAPYGIGACGAWAHPGGDGAGVTICDIEGGWLLRHEDLPPGIRLVGGTMLSGPGALDWRNHGTAVLGEIVSVPGNFGCVGISHAAKAVVQSTVIGRHFNTPLAIKEAARALQPGDVILIELHALHKHGGTFVPMQYWEPVFRAIRSAVGKGIVVVQAAGNGGADLDDPVYDDPESGESFLRKDSGAITVGAGCPPMNYIDGHSQPPYNSMGKARSRMSFSNYGKIVDLQGWGSHVTTLGYGDAQGGRAEKRWYTHRFSGTSSAAPMVAGAVACLQSYAMQRLHRVLTPAEVRVILKGSGAPQVDDAPRAPNAQNIGPQPNLTEAFKMVDQLGVLPTDTAKWGESWGPTTCQILDCPREFSRTSKCS